VNPILEAWERTDKYALAVEARQFSDFADIKTINPAASVAVVIATLHGQQTREDAGVRSSSLVRSRNLSSPFDTSCLRKAGLKGRFVALDSQDRRPLHAKWYEFKAEVSHVLTGSMNATNASMMETTNVEAVVLRKTNPSDVLKWMKKDPLSVRDRSFDRLQSVFNGFLIATLTSDNLLKGSIYNLPNTSGYAAT
jgi:hypothetical protein